MTAVTWVQALTLFFCAAWSVFYLWCIHIFRCLRTLPDVTPLPSLPGLTVIVPACNEAQTIRPALQKLLSQDYPDLHIVAVDDRSTDATYPIIHELAVTDPRLEPLRIEVLAEGWLGKVHALHRGAQRVRTDWILFTDADVHLTPGALRKAVSYAEREGLDHLAMMPTIRTEGFWLDVLVDAFLLIFFGSMRAHLADEPRSKAAFGVGAFNLVRRSTFERTPGFEWLRMEIADDVGLGLMMKQAGGRSRLVLGLQAGWIDWYPSVGSMIRGLEKNVIGPIAHYRLDRFAAFVLTQALAVLAPWIALLLPMPYRLAGILTFGLMGLCGLIISRRLCRSFWGFLFFPVGQALLGYTFWRAAYYCWRNKGILWRGTRYDLARLRAGQRVKI